MRCCSVQTFQQLGLVQRRNSCRKRKQCVASWNLMKNSIIHLDLFLDVKVVERNTLHSYQKEIYWNSITSDAAGEYVCRAKIANGDIYENKTWDLKIVEPIPPVIESNIGDGEELKHLLGELLQLQCNSSGIPRPTLTWYKDGKEISLGNTSRILVSDNATVLTINYIKAEDEGKYRCTATNRIGIASRETTLHIKSNYAVAIIAHASIFSNFLVLS